MERQQGMYTGYTFERCIKDFPNERFELLDGTAYLLMTPPSHVHQEISSNLVGELWSYLKMNLYQANQVAEYWIVDPSNEIIDVYNFRDGAYQFPISYTKI